MGLEGAASCTPTSAPPAPQEFPDLDDYEWLDAPLDSITEKLRLPFDHNDNWCSWCQSPPPGARSATPGDRASTRTPTQGRWTPDVQGRWTPATPMSPFTNPTTRSPSPGNIRRERPSPSRCATPTTPRIPPDLDAMRDPLDAFKSNLGPSYMSSKTVENSQSTVEQAAQLRLPSNPGNIRANRYKRGAWDARRVGSPPAPPTCQAQQASKPSVEKNPCPTVDEFFTSLPPEEKLSVDARGPRHAVDVWHLEENRTGLVLCDSIDVTLDLIDERLEMPGMLTDDCRSMLDSCRISIPEQKRENFDGPRRGAALPTDKRGRIKPKQPINASKTESTSIFDSLSQSVVCRGCGAYGGRRVGAPPPPSQPPPSISERCRSPYLRRVNPEMAKRKTEHDMGETNEEGPWKDADVTEMRLLESFGGKAILRGYGAELEIFRRIVQKGDSAANRNGKLSELLAHQAKLRKLHQSLHDERQAAKNKKNVKFGRFSKKRSTKQEENETRDSMVSAAGDDSEEGSSEAEEWVGEDSTGVSKNILIAKGSPNKQPYDRQMTPKGPKSVPKARVTPARMNSIDLGGALGEKPSATQQQERMKRLKKLEKEKRKLTYKERRRECLTQVGKDEFEYLRKSFDQLLLLTAEKDKKPDDKLKYGDIMQLLYDAGIRPVNAAERAGLKKTFQHIASEKPGRVHLEDLKMTFHELLETLGIARKRLQEVREPFLMDIFSRFDANDKGISLDQIDEILNELGIFPSTQEGIDKLQVSKLEADPDEKGRIGHQDFLFFSKLVENVRENHLKYKAAEQRRIAEELQISEDRSLFAQVRDDLETLRDQFKIFDIDGNNVLDEEEVWAMLGALGLVPKTYGEKQWMAGVMSEFCSTTNTFSFPRFVKLMTKIRNQQKMDMRDHLKQIFRKYDRDSSGELSVSEVARALEDLDMCPRTSAEQKMIQEFLETVGDNVNSGEGGASLISLNFDGFTEFMQHVRERMQASERETEATLASGMGFDTLKLSNFRLAFNTMDSKGTGKVPFAGIRQVCAILKYRVPFERLKHLFLRETKGLNEAEMNFAQFMRVMKELEDQGCKPVLHDDKASDDLTPSTSWMNRPMLDLTVNA